MLFFTKYCTCNWCSAGVDFGPWWQIWRLTVEKEKDRETQMLILTCALLKLDAGAHMDVVDPDVPSTTALEEALDENLTNEREKKEN